MDDVANLMLVRSGGLTRAVVVTVTTAAGTAMGMTHHCLIYMNSVFCKHFCVVVFSELFHKKHDLVTALLERGMTNKFKIVIGESILTTQQFCFTCYVGGLITCTFTYLKISVA